jgi:hypothetical protein
MLFYLCSTKIKPVTMPRGRPRKVENDPRKHFGARIKESNLEWVQAESDRTGKSEGEIVDEAIEALRKLRLYE